MYFSTTKYWMAKICYFTYSTCDNIDMVLLFLNTLRITIASWAFLVTNWVKISLGMFTSSKICSKKAVKKFLRSRYWKVCKQNFASINLVVINWHLLIVPVCYSLWALSLLATKICARKSLVVIRTELFIKIVHAYTS